MSRSIILLKVIAADLAPTIATVIQSICHQVGRPFAARIAPKNAKGSANSVCSNLIIASVIFNFCPRSVIKGESAKQGV